MIVGRLNPTNEPSAPIVVFDAAGVAFPFEVVIDTGFTGSLTLPLDAIRSLGLSWMHTRKAELADGSLVDTDVYRATISRAGRTQDVEVEDAETDPLLGTQLLMGSRLVIDFAPGGTVELLPLPPGRGAATP